MYNSPLSNVSEGNVQYRYSTNNSDFPVNSEHSRTIYALQLLVNY